MTSDQQEQAMKRHRDDDHDSTPGYSTTALILTGLAGILIGSVGGVVAGLTVFRVPAGIASPLKKDPVPTKEEFEKLVMGKTPEEVIAAVGRPDGAEAATRFSPATWTWFDGIRNPVTLKTEIVRIDFSADGKTVARVR